MLKNLLRKNISDNYPKITISLAYYNDGANLLAQLAAFKSYPQTVKIQIIDDGSSQDPIDNHLEYIPHYIDIFKIEPDIPWNISGVRNLSATVATTPWVLILDMDQVISCEEMEKILRLPLDKYFHFYSFNRKLNNITKFTAGTMLVSKELWWKAGGYDEDFVGNYGYNDPFFRFRLLQAGGIEKKLKNIWVVQENADCQLSRSGKEMNQLLFQNKVNDYKHSAVEILRFKWKRFRRE